MDELTINGDNISKIINKEFDLFPKDVALMIGKAESERSEKYEHEVDCIFAYTKAFHLQISFIFK